MDAVRGCIAVERGPLVYCIEGTDHPVGGLDDVVLDLDRAPAEHQAPDLLGGVTVVTGSGWRRTSAPAPSTAEAWWSYRRAAQDLVNRPIETARQRIELTAVPYYAWANREDGSMRIWLPIV